MLSRESSVQDVLNHLRITANRIPAIPCVYPLSIPQFGDGVPQADITSLERTLTSPLPQDFVLFQITCGSIIAMDVWNGYSLLEASQIESLIVDARLHQNEQGAFTYSGTIPIGGDGGGNAFLMTYEGNNHVSKWNHETGDQEKLADSFVAFLRRMLADWEHFVLQDESWKYMSG